MRMRRPRVSQKKVKPMTARLVFVMAVAAGLALASSGEARPLTSCTVDDGSSQAGASGDLAVCGLCLRGGGVCASALDLPIDNP
jgi:hypothetical protein